MSVVKKMMSLGLGIILITEEKVRQVVDELIKKGELAESQKEGLVKEIISKAAEKGQTIEEEICALIEKVFSKMGVATKEDIKRLEEKIDALIGKEG